MGRAKFSKTGEEGAKRGELWASRFSGLQPEIRDCPTNEPPDSSLYAQGILLINKIFN